MYVYTYKITVVYTETPHAQQDISNSYAHIHTYKKPILAKIKDSHAFIVKNAQTRAPCVCTHINIFAHYTQRTKNKPYIHTYMHMLIHSHKHVQNIPPRAQPSILCLSLSGPPDLFVLRPE